MASSLAATSTRTIWLSPAALGLMALCLVLALGSIWAVMADSQRVEQRTASVILGAPRRVTVPGSAGAGIPGSDPAVAEARDLAAAHAESILSYGYKTFSRDRQRARRVMDGSLAAEYDQVMDTTAATVRANRFSLRATVVASSLVSLDAERAVALLFVNSVITSKDSPGRQPARSRVSVTMTRKDGTWIVSQIDALLIN